MAQSFAAFVNAVNELHEKVEPSYMTTQFDTIGKCVYISKLESLPIVEFTNKPADKRFYGIIVNKMEKENTVLCKNYKNEEVIVKTKGFANVWVTNINGNIIEQGDYITSSYLEGYATAQGTITSTNSTIGKVMENIDFSDACLEDRFKVKYISESGLELPSDEFKFNRCHIAIFVKCCL